MLKARDKREQPGAAILHQKKPKTKNSKLETGNWQLLLFRYARGSMTKYVAAKEACLPNAPGTRRHPSGTICGPNYCSDTSGAANCPNLTS